MDDNNRFLDSYKKKMGERTTEPSPAPVTEDAEPAPESEPAYALRFEEKSGFVAPHQTGRARVPPGGFRRPNYLAAAIVGAVVVVGVVVGLLLLLNGGVAVQDFTGWTTNDTALWADTNGVQLQVENQYNDQVDAGKVITQEPKKGASVKKHGFIKVTVSLGHDLTVSVKLPDIMSMTKDEVDKWASDNFMAKVRVTTEFSDSVASGRVISYEINDNTVVGDVVTRNTPIYVVVSKGSEDAAATLITVPDFKQKTISESYQFATDNGIVLTVAEQYDDYAPKGSIIAQSIKADEKVSRGSSITLTVSKGKMITVPDFSLDSRQKAQAKAQELGIVAAVVEKYSTEPVGDFISQSIEAGTVYDGAEVLELDYSLGNEIIVPSFVGQPRDAMDTWAAGLNLQGAGIKVSASPSQSDSPPGTIIYQSYKNTKVKVNSTISITYSTGKKVFVPDLVAPKGSVYGVAITRDMAIKLCQDAGLVPVFNTAVSSETGRLPGEVIAQKPLAGTEVTEGSKVTITYVKYTAFPVPDFTTMTEDDILNPIAPATDYRKQFEIEIVESNAYPVDPSGKITAQSVRALSTAASGSKIILYRGPTS